MVRKNLLLTLVEAKIYLAVVLAVGVVRAFDIGKILGGCYSAVDKLTARDGIIRSSVVFAVKIARKVDGAFVIALHKSLAKV